METRSRKVAVPGGSSKMAVSDLTRIRSNVQGLHILQTLRDVNNEVAMHQLRLGTGKKINSAGDDPAGLSISTKLDARNRILGARGLDVVVTKLAQNREDMASEDPAVSAKALHSAKLRREALDPGANPVAKAAAWLRENLKKPFRLWSDQTAG